MSQKFGTRREKAKAETRRVILESAYSLFEEKGFEKTTMRLLAAKAGVGLGTIFQHFPEKTQLAAAAFEDDVEEQVEIAFNTLPETGLRDQLLHFARTFYSFYALRPQLFRVLLSTIIFTQKSTTDIVDALVYRFLDRLGALFHVAIDRGEVRPDIDIEAAAGAFWSFYTMSLVLGLKAREFDAETQVNMLARLLDQHFQGLRP